MHVSVTTGQLQPGKLDEFIGKFNDVLVPVGRELKGYNGSMVLADREANKVVVVTQWDSPQDAQAAAEKWRQLLGEVAPLLAGQPEREMYELALEVKP